MEKKDEQVWDCGSPLYDAYELVSLANIIERHMMMMPSASQVSFISREELVEEEEKKKTTFVIFQKKKANWVMSKFYGILSRICLTKRSCIMYV